MRTLAIAVVLATALSVLTSGQPQAVLVIAGATVIPGDGPSRIANVVVRDGRIAAIEPAGPAPAAATVLEGGRRFLVPGLWDMHVHLATRPEPMLAERMMLPLFLAYGIVGVRDMGGPLDRVLALRQQVGDGTLTGPRILTPGPFVDGPGDPDPMFRRPAAAADAEAEVRTLREAGVDFVKAQSGLTPDTHRALARASGSANLALAGHIPVAMTAEAVIGSGQRTIEHVSPALIGDGLLLFGCSNRSAELIAELRAIERDRATAAPAAIGEREAALRKRVIETYDPQRARALGRSMSGRPIWIVPTLVFSASLRPVTRESDGTDLPMDVVPAAIRTRWLDRRKQFIDRQPPAAFEAAAALAATAGRAVRDLQQGGAKILAGTDAVDAFVLPGHSLHQELGLLVDAGFSPLEALQAATRNAAEYRGTLKTEGTITVGKRADLVLLDADPLTDIANTGRVNATIVGGRVYSRADLDTLLAGVHAFSAK